MTSAVFHMKSDPFQYGTRPDNSCADPKATETIFYRSHHLKSKCRSVGRPPMVCFRQDFKRGSSARILKEVPQKTFLVQGHPIKENWGPRFEYMIITEGPLRWMKSPVAPKFVSRTAYHDFRNFEFLHGFVYSERPPLCSPVVVWSIFIWAIRPVR